MVQTTNAILMCFPTPKPPTVQPPAPPPPTPPAPPAPKPLAEPKKLEDDTTRPKVQYGRKKSADVRARSGTDSLKIPLNTPNTGGNSGGLNV